MAQPARSDIGKRWMVVLFSALAVFKALGGEFLLAMAWAAMAFSWRKVVVKTAAGGGEDEDREPGAVAGIVVLALYVILLWDIGVFGAIIRWLS